MNQPLQQYLYNKYPLIFEEIGLPPEKSSMAWGITCGDGWYYLLDCLCSNIQGTINNHNDSLEKGYIKGDKIPQVVAQQIKEKFGGLRFYYKGGNEKIGGMIDFAESLSYNICEKCGGMKNVGHTTKGWIQTLCKECVGDKIDVWKPII